MHGFILYLIFSKFFYRRSCISIYQRVCIHIFALNLRFVCTISVQFAEGYCKCNGREERPQSELESHERYSLRRVSDRSTQNGTNGHIARSNPVSCLWDGFLENDPGYDEIYPPGNTIRRGLEQRAHSSLGKRARARPPTPVTIYSLQIVVSKSPAGKLCREHSSGVCVDHTLPQ